MTQYFIKMDLNKWRGAEDDLHDGKEYPIYQDGENDWYLDDEIGDYRECGLITGWGDYYELNTSIAYTKDIPVSTDKSPLVEVILENLIKITEANPASSTHCDLIIEAVEELTK